MAIDLPMISSGQIHQACVVWNDAINAGIDSAFAGVATEATLAAVLAQLQAQTAALATMQNTLATMQNTLASLLTAQRAIDNCDNIEAVTLSDSKVTAYRVLYCVTAGTAAIKSTLDASPTPFVMAAKDVLREFNIVRVMATGSTGAYIGGW